MYIPSPPPSSDHPDTRHPAPSVAPQRQAPPRLPAPRVTAAMPPALNRRRQSCGHKRRAAPPQRPRETVCARRRPRADGLRAGGASRRRQRASQHARNHRPSLCAHGVFFRRARVMHEHTQPSDSRHARCAACRRIISAIRRPAPVPHPARITRCAPHLVTLPQPPDPCTRC